MDINPVSTQPAVPPGEAAALRPAVASDAKTQPGEGPSEQRDGVGRPASAQDDRIEVRAQRQPEAAPALSDDQRRQVRELAARDREVRAHEAAHRAAAGPYARGVSFSYQQGPDGQRYAVGGEVQIDTAPVPGDPQATLRKAETVRRAALAPAQPSGQDRQVAAQAAAVAAQARAEIQRQATQNPASAPGTALQAYLGDVDGPAAEVDLFA